MRQGGQDSDSSSIGRRRQGGRKGSRRQGGERRHESAWLVTCRRRRRRQEGADGVSRSSLTCGLESRVATSAARLTQCCWGKRGGREGEDGKEAGVAREATARDDVILIFSRRCTATECISESRLEMKEKRNHAFFLLQSTIPTLDSRRLMLRIRGVQLHSDSQSALPLSSSISLQKGFLEGKRRERQDETRAREAETKKSKRTTLICLLLPFSFLFSLSLSPSV